jgi:uncharacterized membrane protein YkoI
MKKKTVWITAGAAAAVLVVAGVGVAVADPFDNDSDDRLTGTALEQASEAALDEVGEGRVTDSERSDDPDHAYEIEVTLENGQEIEVELDEDFGVVRVDDGTRDGDDDSRDDDGRDDDGQDDDSATGSPSAAPDAAITDAERSSAESAALAAAGGGTVTELERSDDADHAWEVEVTLADGTDVDVELDAAFAVTKVDR